MSLWGDAREPQGSVCMVAKMPAQARRRAGCSGRPDETGTAVTIKVRKPMRLVGGSIRKVAGWGNRPRVALVRLR